MTPLRSFAVGLVAGALIAFAPGCITDPVCGPSNCLGCCTADGECTLGNLTTACGANGGACAVCASSEVCNAAVCTPSHGGGGNGDGGTGGDGGVTDGGTGGTIAIDDICDELPAAVCAYYVRCGLAASQATCEQFFNALLFSGGDCLPAERAAIKDGRIAYDGAKAKACIEYYADELECGFEGSEAPGDCAGMFVGQVETGGVCYDSEECGPGESCAATASTCPGQCKARHLDGESFTDNTGEECAEGLNSYYTPAVGAPFGTRTCYKPIDPNQSCAPPNTTNGPLVCIDGYYCTSDTFVCAPQKPPDATCTKYDECQSPGRCAQGLCRVPGGINDPCSNDGVLSCKIDLVCKVALGANAGLCAAPSTSGATCTREDACAPGLYCDGLDTSPSAPMAGKCTPRHQAGGTCSSNNECAEGTYCNPTSGQCTPQRAPGSSCSNVGNECGGSSYCDGTTCVLYDCEDPTP